MTAIPDLPDDTIHTADDDVCAAEEPGADALDEVLVVMPPCPEH